MFVGDLTVRAGAGQRICVQSARDPVPLSQDLDFATRDDTPLPEIAEHVRHAFRAEGYSVRLVEATSRYARLVLRLPGSGEKLEMDLLKEALEPSWVTVQITPAAGVRALSLDDTVGLKARAWYDRFVIRDIIDLHGIASAFSYIDLENLARRHDPDLDLEAILDHLAGVSVFPNDDFAEYGLDEPGSPTCADGSRDGMTISLGVSPRTVPTMNSPMTPAFPARPAACGSGGPDRRSRSPQTYSSWRRIQVWNASPSSRPFGVRSRTG
jgi:hypothetical protein